MSLFRTIISICSIVRCFEQLKHVGPDTTDLAPRPTAGCCRLVTLVAWSQSHYFVDSSKSFMTIVSWRSPVVCLSSVFCCLWRRWTLSRDLNFSAIFLRRLIARGLGQFVPKFWAKNRRDSMGSCKLNTRGMKKWSFFSTCRPKICVYLVPLMPYLMSNIGATLKSEMGALFDRSHTSLPL